MPQNANEKEELDVLDREIALQKKIAKRLEDAQKPVTTVYTWEAPERDYNPKNKRWYLIMGIVALFFIALAALTQNYLLVFTIVALVVVIYTINTIPPHDTTHQLTNKGLYSFNTIFLWKNMISFWVTQRGRKYFLHIEYKGKASDVSYKTMVILVGKGNIEKIVTYMVGFVDYLGPDEVSYGALSEYSHGKYVPLLDIVGDTDVLTKDPNDAPFLLKANKSNSK